MILPLLALSLSACTIDDVEPMELSVPVLVRGVDHIVEVDEELSYEITTARITLSDFRFERDDDHHAQVRRLSLIPVAHAHPGHDDHDHGHADVGELLGTFEVDLRAGDTVLGDARVFAGHVHDAQFHLRPDPTLVIEGTRRTATVDRSFRFELTPDLEVDDLDVRAHVQENRSGQSFALRIDLARLLSEVDWETPDANGDDLLTVDEGEIEADLLDALDDDVWVLTFDGGSEIPM